jgi:hypothetical protein
VPPARAAADTGQPSRAALSPRGRPVASLAAALAILLAGAAGLAISPDSLWIDGVYDGADLDDLVASVASTDGLPMAPHAATLCAPSPGAACHLRPAAPSRAPVRASPAPRAPPNA